MVFRSVIWGGGELYLLLATDVVGCGEGSEADDGDEGVLDGLHDGFRWFPVFELWAAWRGGFMVGEAWCIYLCICTVGTVRGEVTTDEMSE